MGSGAKVVLVALLIIMVVVVAKVVQKGSDPKVTGKNDATLAGAKNPNTAANPSGLNSGPGTGTGNSAVRPGTGTTGSTGKITNAPRQNPAPSTGSPVGSGPQNLAGQNGSAGANPGAQQPSRPAVDPKAPAPGASGAIPASGSGTPSANLADGSKSGAVTNPGLDRTPPVVSSKVELINPGNGQDPLKKSDSTLATGESGAPGSVNPSNTVKGVITPSLPLAGDTAKIGQPGSGSTGSPGTKPSTPSVVQKPPETKTPSFSDPFSPINPKDKGSSGVTHNDIPSVPVPVPAAGSKDYVVKKGDGYWKIAESVYGAGYGKFARTIQAANKDAKLIPGQKLSIPPLSAETIALANPVGTAGKASKGSGANQMMPTDLATDERFISYQVQKGDTWMRIAERFYKDPNAFPAIQAANRKVSYETLRVGQKIQIPKR